MQLEAKSILQVLGRWSRRPDFSRLCQLRHADTTPDSLLILDLQIYSLNWLSILQVLGRWSRRPDFSRLRQLRHADTTPDSLLILDLQIYSLNWLSYGPRAWPLFNQMPPPPPNKSQTPVRTHSYLGRRLICRHNNGNNGARGAPGIIR